MPRFSYLHKQSLVVVAGVLYALSLHKYSSRDALSAQTGIQGPLEFGLTCVALACSFLAARHAPRRYAVSPALVCFAVYGIFALASSWRSFNPPLSIAKGLLLFAVLAIGYLTGETGLSNRLFQSIYWSYTATLAFGLLLGLALPGRFPLWSVDDFTGRSRLSVYDTFPGTMGETAAYLVLLSPIIFRNSHWLSRLFLVLMNLAAGGKTSSALLVLLMAFEYVAKIRTARSWPVVVLVGGICLAVPAVAWLGLSNNAGLQLMTKSTSIIYGHDISGEAVSLDGRLALWKSSFALLQDSSLLGYGFDGAREALLKVAEWSGSSHNGFLELGLAGGVGGLTIFLIGLGDVLRTCWRSHPYLRRRVFLVLIYMLCIALTGITFNFPSYFGLLVLILLLYRTSTPANAPSFAVSTPQPTLAGNEEQPCQA